MSPCCPSRRDCGTIGEHQGDSISLERFPLEGDCPATMTVVCYSTEHHGLFEMDGVGVHQPSEMDDDYGEFVDLDLGDDAAASLVPLPSDEESSPPISVCSSRIGDKDVDSLVSYPPILAPSMVDAVVEEGLPWSMQDTQWDRLFASSRDGTSFSTFMRQVRGYKQTIIVVKTSSGRIVGGYATDVWSGRRQLAGPEDGSGDAFLFVVDQSATKIDCHATAAGHTFIPGFGELGSSPTSIFDLEFHRPSVSYDKLHVEIFKPKQQQQTGNVELNQACQIGKKLISMGDGGELSLVIEGSFSRGVAHTGRSREEFAVVEFEVYGFSED